MSTNPFKENMICDLGTIKAQSQLPISMSTPITCESQMAANTKPTRPHRRSRSKVVTGLPKSLCLLRLCGLENIASVLIVKQESPWDTYRKVITYEIAGKVTIATRRTRPSRMILDGARYLALSGLAHQSLACDDILLGIDGMIKIACLDLCVDCTPDQSEATYIAALPLITMRLMQRCDKDEGVVGVNDLERWPRFRCCGISVRYRDGRNNQVSEKSTPLGGEAPPKR
ncbi:hypothetical protein AAEP93_009257 [Penicillium crustosum]